MASVEEVREQLERLNGLMADPQPGLFTWKMAFGRALDDFCEYEKERDKQRELEATIERFRAYRRARMAFDNQYGSVDEDGTGVWLAERLMEASAALTLADMGETP